MQRAHEAYMKYLHEAIHKFGKPIKTEHICVHLRSSAVYKFIDAEKNREITFIYSLPEIYVGGIDVSHT